MTRTKESWWDRLNGALFPYLGPPELGPYDQPPSVPVAGMACPICHQAMSLHEIERNSGRTPTRLVCP